MSHGVASEQGYVERIELVARALTGDLEASEIIEIVLQQALAAVGADGGVVALVTDSRHLSPVRTIGYPAAHVAAFSQMSVDLDLPLTTAARTNEPVWVESPEDALKRFPDLLARPTVSHAWVAVPLVMGDTPFGVLGVSFRVRRPHDAADLSLLRTLADLSSVALFGRPSPPLAWTDRVLDVLSDGVVVTDHADVVLSANRAAGSMTGRSSSSLVGRALGEFLITPADLGTPTSRPPLGRPAKRGPDWTVSAVAVHADGSQFSVAVHVESIGQGKDAVNVVVVHDLRAQQQHDDYVRTILGFRNQKGGSGAGQTLTLAELRVARLLCEGLSNHEIADAAFVSHETVKSHLSSIYNKLGVTGRAATITRILLDPDLAAQVARASLAVIPPPD